MNYRRHGRNTTADSIVAIGAALAASIAIGTGAAAAGAAQADFDCPSPPAGMNVIQSDAAEIFGTNGDDFICAGPSDNTISGRGGNDIIYAGAGDDVVFGRAGDDRIHGQDGNDVLRGSGGNDVIQGDDGNDRVRGGEGNDLLIGDAGNDRMDGGFGSDELHGGADRDVLNGRRGADELRGGSGNDWIRGGVGSDEVRGDQGNDKLLGGFGNDVVSGGSGNDEIYGNEGADELDGGIGNDRISGDSGADIIEGGPGIDRSDGGAQSDDCNSSEWYLLCERGGEDLVDADGDRVGDVIDNCVDKPNPFQTDSDRDGIGELCDEETKIPVTGVGQDDAFGSAVDVSGESIVAGAPGDDELGAGAGAAYVFVPDQLGGLTEIKLTASDGDSEDLFGSSVAIDGDTIVVGAEGDEDGGTGSGSVYVFTPDGNGGFDEEKLTASDGATGDAFGAVVAVDAGVIAVGAALDDSLTGGVYVYTPDGDGGYDETKLTASDSAAGDLFGSAIATDGVNFVVAATGDDLLSGSVYVYSPDGQGGFDEVKISPSDALPGGRFGTGVAIDGDSIIVSAFPDSGGATAVGSLYVFTPDGLGGYVEEKIPSGGIGGDGFGSALTASNGTIMVGAHLADVGVTDSGSVHVFSPDGVTGFDEAVITVPEGGIGDFFGRALGSDGETFVAGAPFDDESAGDGGAVYRLMPGEA